MPTRRIVPRNDGEGSIGKPSKQWGDVQTKKINGTSIAEGGTATTSAVGVVKLATSMETQTGTSTTSAVTPAALKAYTEWRPSGFKNLIINGAFFVNQRGYVSGAATSGANEYTLDRWRVVTSGQALSFADSNGTRTITTPAGGIEQVIEGAWVRSGTYTIAWTGTATCTVDGTARTSGESFTISGGANVTVRFSGGTVSNSQLELGSVATPFEYRPIGVELALCQRYYWKQVGYTLQKYVSGININSERFPVPMRATPTMVIFSQNNNEAGNIYNASTSANVTGSPAPTGTDGYSPSVSGGGYSVGDALCYYVTASAEL